MGSRDKTLPEKLRSFFRIRSGTDSFVPTGRENTGLVLTPEIEKDLSAETPILQRLKNIKDLHDKILHCRLDSLQTVERLWLCVADLIQPEQPKECRHAGLIFLGKLIEGQFDLINFMRGQFFKIITCHNHPEDNHFRLELLQTLTSNGKDIKHFEEEIFNFMLQWMPTVALHPELSKEFLMLLVNLIKFNAAYMSKDVITGFVSNTCYLCCETHVVPVGLSCLQVLDAIVCYSIFPHESIQIFVSSLCRTVNDEQYCPTSWKIMRCMLGTDLGHTTLHIMCSALGTSCDNLMTRGAVFYLYMALWGPKRVNSLRCTPTQVLPSFLKALEGNQSVVSYEVILAMQVLVQKHGHELHEPTWDLIFAIISTIITQLGQSHSPIPVISRCLHETITAIEQIHENGQFNGSVENLYALIDSCGHTRPDQSVIKLITHLTTQIVPTNYEWLTILNKLVECYCRQESRVNIRIKVLETLQTIVEQNRFSYEEELLDKVVLPNLQQCSTEADPVIRCHSAKLLIDIALHCHSKRFTDIFDILEKLLNRPYELYVTAEPISLSSETDVNDITVVANGIVRIFLHKYRQLPSAHAVRAYLAVLNNLQQHYAKPSLFEKHPHIRLKLLEWFLSARANLSYHVGFPSENGDRILYSPYLCIEGSDVNVRPSHSPTPQTAHQISGMSLSQVSYVSIRKACKVIITCLKHEKDWSVLQVVLKEIPNVMQNKALVLSKNSNDIDQLASALCAMVVNTNLVLPESLYNTSGKLTKSDFHASVLPVLTCLAPYHTHLDSQLQQRIIKCVVKFGLVSKCVQQCVTALTIFTLEMRDTMMKLVPEVLLDLSKISATVYIAVPILEFLSTLTRLPKVYASFVGDQYMSVFAILLPYTNPFKYNHYIVSLAHHVIAAWFLKCRLPFRRDFVTFIKHGLHNNILKPFEEGKFSQDFNLDLNQDSSSRKRSSSLTEQGSRRRELLSRPALGELRTPQEASNTFHVELTETCIDLMARYTYSPCISAPKRSPTADFLLNGGQSMTWLLGHKIITVTTSGCLQNALRQGLCERCLILCKAHADSMQSPYNGAPGTNCSSDEGLNSDIKRYSKYTLQHSKSNETTNSSSSISDNILFPPSCHNNLSLQSLSGHTTRQNSAENKSDGASCSPKAMTDVDSIPTSQLSLKLESLANKQMTEEEKTMSRLDRVNGGILKSVNSSNNINSGVPENRLHCACWCGGWAEIHVRGPTGDVSWVIRLQNQGNLDTSLCDLPLNDISSLYLPSLSYGMFPLNIGGIPPSLGSATSIVSSGFADTRSDVLSDDDPRSRSGSGGSQPDQIQKSSSDSVVSGTNVGSGASSHVPHASTYFIVPPNHNTNGASLTAISNNSKTHTTTDPINIPGSPQRQNSSGTNTDDEDGQINSNDPSQALDEQGKSRHPVRRSNSSPEMSSSWKNPFHMRMEGVDGECNEPKTGDADRPQSDSHDVAHKSADENIGSTIQQSKKGTMKSLTKDMRVSCEAIPEEMSSFTPPQMQHLINPHPHLMTYNSDPGSVAPADIPQVSSTSVSEKNIVHLANTQFDNVSKVPQTQAVPESNPKPAKSNQTPLTSKNVNITNEKLLTAHEHLKVSSKPPHSPAPASPRPTNRLQGLSTSVRNTGSNIPINRSASLIPSDASRVSNLNLKLNELQNSQQIGVDDLPPLSRSKRSNTISVMSPTRKRREKSKDSSSRSGISPAFVFLQFYHGMGVGGTSGEKPLLLSEDQHTRSVKLLDLIPPLETYKVGVLYVGPGQHDNETKILRNEFGSLRYAEFLQDLGTLIALEDAKSLGLFLNVERGGRDGRFAYVWQDDIMQVHFHVATLMPNNASDPECNEKRKHIGNDFVSIVYNESGEDFLIQTIKGQFNFVCIIIEPLDHGTNKVTIKTKDDLIEKEFLSQFDPKIISDQNVALLARQLALHANLASLISRSLSTKPVVPYASNWLERLRSIKRLRNKLLEEKNTSKESNGASSTSSSADARRSHMEDFTEYT